MRRPWSERLAAVDPVVLARWRERLAQVPRFLQEDRDVVVARFRSAHAALLAAVAQGAGGIGDPADLPDLLAAAATTSLWVQGRFEELGLAWPAGVPRVDEAARGPLEAILRGR